MHLYLIQTSVQEVDLARVYQEFMMSYEKTLHISTLEAESPAFHDWK